METTPGEFPRREEREEIENPTLRANRREHGSELVEILRTAYGFRIEFAPLKYGDFFVPPDTVVERLTVPEFCTALADGRLFRLAYRLVEYTKTPILVIEGASLAPRETGTAPQTIRGALVTLAQTFRLPVLRTRDAKDTAGYLAALFRQRERLGVPPAAAVTENPGRVETHKLVGLRTLPGIGPKLAAILLDAFGSVEHIARASEEELARVPGIGPARAKWIRKVLREKDGLFEISEPTRTQVPPAASRRTSPGGRGTAGAPAAE